MTSFLSFSMFLGLYLGLFGARDTRAPDIRIARRPCVAVRKLTLISHVEFLSTAFLGKRTEMYRLILALYKQPWAVTGNRSVLGSDVRTNIPVDLVSKRNTLDLFWKPDHESNNNIISITQSYRNISNSRRIWWPSRPKILFLETYCTRHNSWECSNENNSKRNEPKWLNVENMLRC